jgi:hypothetical protein
MWNIASHYGNCGSSSQVLLIYRGYRWAEMASLSACGTPGAKVDSPARFCTTDER